MHFLLAKTLLIAKHQYATLKSVYSLSNTTANNNGRSISRPGTIVPVIHHDYRTDCHAIFSARQHAERAICYRPSVRLSVCLSVCLSVRHTGGSVKNG